MTVGCTDVGILMRSGMVKMSLHFSLGNSLSGCILLYIEVCLCTSNSDQPSPISDSGDTEESPHRVHNLVGGGEQAMLGNKKAPGDKGSRLSLPTMEDAGQGGVVKQGSENLPDGAHGVRAPK